VQAHSAAADVFTQLQYFQANREKLGIIVDANDEAQGVVTRQEITWQKINIYDLDLQ
jgi:Mg2+/Co2+ transporter CorB